jgi:hypothetical protein
MHSARLRAVTLVLLVAAFVGLSAGPAAAAPAPTATDVGTLTSTVTGTFTDASGGVGTFTGTFAPQQFVDNGGTATAVGTVTGDLVDSTGTPVGTASAPATTAVDAVQAAGCQVLDLNLAPLDLDLLGLTVHLDRVHLNITAVPGAGNLLGNLLCAVAGLLDPLGAVAQFVALLNQILALLGG